MKARFLICVLLLSVCCVAAQCAVAQTTTQTPQKEPEVTYDEILKRLRFRSSPYQPDAEISAELVDAIQTRGIWFLLNDKDRQVLKTAGASDELLDTIDHAVPESERKRLRDIIGFCSVIAENYGYADGERQRRMVAACKEFLAKYGDEPRLKEQLEWIRQALPKLELRLKELETTF